jgi:hypothetical protein
MTFRLHRVLRQSVVCALVLPGILLLRGLASGDEALQPPIDRKAWMVSSPTQPLKVLKAPSYGPDYPNLTDYMRVLERFPLQGERGWRGNYLGDPNLGFFGDPDSSEMGLRAMGNYIFVMALLAADPAYDDSVTGISREHVLKRARQCLDYMTRSHVTGDIVCGDGKKWGDHWQSAWWAAKMALGAQLIWDRLSPEQRERVERVVTHEASRHLSRKAPGGSFRDTKSEENAWDTEVMAAAIALFPKHPKAPEWRAKLIEFDLNSLSTLDDQTSSAIVDGRPLKEQVYTENVHADYTIENHGAYHTCYMSCPLHSLAWGYYALTSAKQPVPEAQFHHFVDVWERMKPTFLDRRFAYVEGKDWPRYAYGMYFIMPALVTLQQPFGDQAAREIEKRRFRTFEEEQYSNGDGTFFGKRFTLNQMMHRLSEYETDCYANLGACYLLHKGKGAFMKPPSSADYQRMVSGGFVSEPAEFAVSHSPELFSSFAWKALNGRYPIALFIPAGMDDAAEWGLNNLTGRIEAAGIDPKLTRSEHTDRADWAGFHTAGRLTCFSAENSRPAYSHEIEYTVNTVRGTALIDCRFIAHQPITVNSIEGLRLLVQSDIFNKGRRRYLSDEGSKLVAFDINAPQPEKETMTNIRVGDAWVNIDNRLGIVRLHGSEPFVLRNSNRRNAPWGSIHFDALDCPAPGGPRSFGAGDEILHTRFLLVAGDARKTARLAEDANSGIGREERILTSQARPR